MGFTEGKGLGIDKQGRLEPLPIAIKRDRKGIGEQPKPKPKPKRHKTETPKSSKMKRLASLVKV